MSDWFVDVNVVEVKELHSVLFWLQNEVISDSHLSNKFSRMAGYLLFPSTYSGQDNPATDAVTYQILRDELYNHIKDCVPQLNISSGIALQLDNLLD